MLLSSNRTESFQLLLKKDFALLPEMYADTEFLQNKLRLNATEAYTPLSFPGLILRQKSLHKSRCYLKKNSSGQKFHFEI